MSQHSLAETYAILTSAPLTPRIQPAEALLIIERNILPIVGIAELNAEDYQDVVRRMAANGWRSGRIYDALHLQCAENIGAERIHTFNVKEFQQLAPHLADRICAPTGY